MSVGRILSTDKDIKVNKEFSESPRSGKSENLNDSQSTGSLAKGGHVSHFLPTSRRIVQFSNGKVNLLYFVTVIIHKEVSA